ncbi:CBS domain-containing protein [Enterococcus sp. JM4C]|uniref:cyclic-di-AMP-binding protein CbpB n=1 Tax=Candidatus Enterococcus huntleyi TaxID=1857217 RepID=UPI00137B176D|nr:cyclic-di-AMP-binding protein CbpB [Enterococcus sp. JM4C]KAF1296597.1 CBS domain-containing protein [Enterococcus sp. JM4C]
MIGPTVKELLLENQETFLIPANNVANVMVEHPLDHCLLVLSKVGYSKIPVLDKEDHLVGLVSLTEVVEKMIDLKEINMAHLNGLAVADVMETSVAVVTEDWDLEEVLHLLVDLAFLPVVNEERVFKGIITRKEILKAVNHMAHELERKNMLLPKASANLEKQKIG